MNDKTDTPTAIRLLILSSSFDHTEQITTFLRNGGLAVHSTRLEEMNDLEESLQTEECDLVLCCAFDARIDLRQTLDAVNDLERDLPLLIMPDPSANPTELLQAMREGARDLVDKDDLEHLQLVVAREFGDLQQRRELTTLKQRLQESEERALGLIERSHEAIAFIQEGIHVHVNPTYLEMFGFEDGDAIEDLPLLDVIDKSQHKALRTTLKQLQSDAGKHGAILDTQCRRQDGSTVEATLYFAKASMEGEPCLQVIVRPKQNSAQEMNKKLRRLSRLDADTRLPNRQYFQAKMVHWVGAAAEDGHARALIYLSIDNVAKLRGSLGMARIDVLVKDVAALLQDEIDKDDLLARFSASSFTLLCRRPLVGDIGKLAKALRAKVDAAHYPDIDPALGPACSIGIALLGDATENVQDIIDEAYNACETASKQGGNQVYWNREEPEPERSEIGDETNKIIQQIEDALKRDRFRLVFQPIVSLQGDTRENYAVLVRMLDDNDDEYLPDTFIEQAERYGKMVDIDRLIIRRAIATLTEQRQEGRKVNLFVSLSEPSLKDKKMLLWICDCLREFDARGSWLTFQINEQHARDNLRHVTKLVDGLKKIRCQIAIDHFGLLANPEMVLNSLQVDFVKFAPSFIEEINTNQQKQDDLNTLNTLVSKHSVKSVATAVEDANSLTVLWTLGVGYIQGYFLQEPSETIDYAVQRLV
jgi:diguanylate cyclase (GGDEF)-like protein/PAS domain S-box-containing protein